MAFRPAIVGTMEWAVGGFVSPIFEFRGTVVALQNHNTIRSGPMSAHCRYYLSDNHLTTPITWLKQSCPSPNPFSIASKCLYIFVRSPPQHACPLCNQVHRNVSMDTMKFSGQRSFHIESPLGSPPDSGPDNQWSTSWEPMAYRQGTQIVHNTSVMCVISHANRETMLSNEQ